MIIKKRFKIYSWANWDHTINATVEKFYTTHKRYPSILMASTRTHARMDTFTNKTPRQRKNCTDIRTSKPPKTGDEGQIAAFSGKCYRLKFCLDEKILANHFCLVFDLNPEYVHKKAGCRSSKPTKRPA
ncbi:MAG: hypothetical protein A2252_06270 [Elusimicrobia bacterium RIFOXYA2_FULL_39_19]|nr:MAG: hypothetical protein A2252_06270 [Elusimicrobia bacterium RIFOXYA2_FULL_39_19]